MARLPMLVVVMVLATLLLLLLQAHGRDLQSSSWVPHIEMIRDQAGTDNKNNSAVAVAAASNGRCHYKIRAKTKEAYGYDEILTFGFFNSEENGISFSVQAEDWFVEAGSINVMEVDDACIHPCILLKIDDSPITAWKCEFVEVTVSGDVDDYMWFDVNEYIGQIEGRKTLVRNKC